MQSFFFRVPFFCNYFVVEKNSANQSTGVHRFHKKSLLQHTPTARTRDILSVDCKVQQTHFKRRIFSFKNTILVFFSRHRSHGRQLPFRLKRRRSCSLQYHTLQTSGAGHVQMDQSGSLLGRRTETQHVR